MMCFKSNHNLTNKILGEMRILITEAQSKRNLPFTKRGQSTAKHQLKEPLEIENHQLRFLMMSWNLEWIVYKRRQELKSTSNRKKFSPTLWSTMTQLDYIPNLIRRKFCKRQIERIKKENKFIQWTSKMMGKWWLSWGNWRQKPCLEIGRRPAQISPRLLSVDQRSSETEITTNITSIRLKTWTTSILTSRKNGKLCHPPR